MPKQLTLDWLRGDLAFVQARLDESARSDIYGTERLMWENRKTQIEAELKRIQDAISNFASVALIFDGEPVAGSTEIRADFAAKAIETYQNFVSVIYAEKLFGKTARRGQARASDESRLFIRDIVHGSMGFILDEISKDQGELVQTALKEAVEEGAKLIGDLAKAEQKDFAAKINELQPRVVQSLKRFTGTLHDFNARTKIASDDSVLDLKERDITVLNDWLNAFEIKETDVKSSGEILGILPESAEFEFKPVGEEIIKGAVSDEIIANYMKNPNYSKQVTRQAVEVTLHYIKTVRGDVVEREQVILVRINPGKNTKRK